MICGDETLINSNFPEVAISKMLCTFFFCLHIKKIYLSKSCNKRCMVQPLLGHIIFNCKTLRDDNIQ